MVNRVASPLAADLFANEEDQYRVLKATCTELNVYPYPQHSYLCHVHLGLSSDMRKQKLTLGFSDYVTTRCSSKRTLGRGYILNMVELEPVADCTIMDWWHPKYPRPSFRIIPPSGINCVHDEW